MIVLETERLALRVITRDDIDFVHAMVSDPEVMRWYPRVLDRAGAEAWLQRVLDRYAKDGHGFWLVLDKATGEPRGQVGLLVQEVDGARESEIGWLVHRPFWRQGIAKEAARGVRRWARERGHARIISLIRPENVPSAKTAASLGCRIEKPVQFHGYLHDAWLHPERD